MEMLRHRLTIEDVPSSSKHDELSSSRGTNRFMVDHGVLAKDEVDTVLLVVLQSSCTLRVTTQQHTKKVVFVRRTGMKKIQRKSKILWGRDGALFSRLHLSKIAHASFARARRNGIECVLMNKYNNVFMLSRKMESE